MKLIQGNYINRIVISKSEFITRLYRVNNVDEVNEFLADVRKKHYDASHNCYAYIIGSNKEIKKSSDDGEPAKTAGAPMLDALEKNDVTNILAITTRYFGGILLGASGLVRAYSKSVSEALELVDFYEIKKEVIFTLNTSYSGYNTLIKALPYAKIDNVSFNTDVVIEGTIPIDKKDTFKDDLFKYKIDALTLAEKGLKDVEVKIEKDEAN